jgi:hypothetical protein
MWPECQWPLTIVTDKINIKTKEKVVYTKMGRIYGTYMTYFMNNFVQDDEHIIVLLEDYILKSVDVPLIERAYALMKADSNIGCIRLYPKPGPTMPYGEDPEIGEINRADLYVASLQACMWRTDTFRGILGPGEDPWQTEEAGSWRARHMPENIRFLATYKEAMDYHNYCSKGRLDDNVSRWIRENR